MKSYFNPSRGEPLHKFTKVLEEGKQSLFRTDHQLWWHPNNLPVVSAKIVAENKYLFLRVSFISGNGDELFEKDIPLSEWGRKTNMRIESYMDKENLYIKTVGFSDNYLIMVKNKVEDKSVSFCLSPVNKNKHSAGNDEVISWGLFTESDIQG